MGLKSKKKRQDGHKKDIRSVKVQKNIMYTKCYFPIRKRYVLSLGGSQDERERLRKAPKTHMKSFKTSKNKGSKSGPNNLVFGG